LLIPYLRYLRFALWNVNKKSKIYEYNASNIFKNKPKTFDFIQNNEIKSKTKVNKCNPIDLTYKNYQVKLNNKYYPTHYQLYRNKSINFKCLNESKQVKKILLWTKFYNSYTDYYYGFVSIPIELEFHTKRRK
jgi:ASC-1-like (ASCH) protein